MAEYSQLIADILSNTYHGDLVRPELVQALIDIESSGNPYAIRFEPHFYKELLNKSIQTFSSDCTVDTERVMRATSWGLMQIMGETARNLGFDNKFLSELIEPGINLKYGCLYLARSTAINRKQYGIKGGIAAYNAGRIKLDSNGQFVNLKYVNKVMAKYQELHDAKPLEA